MPRKSILSSSISIPDYWKTYVNPNVDLEKEPKQACPFHNEQHGQSFSYKAEKGYFSCFGACHVYGGDVVQLHMLNYKIKDYDKAEESLARLYHINLKSKELHFEKKEVKVDEKNVALRVAYAQACNLATGPEAWLELDMIMSQYPTDYDKLKIFVNTHRKEV